MARKKSQAPRRHTWPGVARYVNLSIFLQFAYRSTDFCVSPRHSPDLKDREPCVSLSACKTNMRLMDRNATARKTVRVAERREIATVHIQLRETQVGWDTT